MASTGFWSGSSTRVAQVALTAILWAIPAAAGQPKASAPEPGGTRASGSASSQPGAAPTEPPCPPGAYCERVELTPPPPQGEGGAGAPATSGAPGPAPVEPLPDSTAGTDEPEQEPLPAPSTWGDGTLPNDPYLLDQPPSDGEERDYEPGDPVPLGYHVEEVPNDGLLAAGGVVLGVSYVPLLVIGIAAAGTEDEDLALYTLLALPVLGPPMVSAIANTSDVVTGIGLGVSAAQATGFLLIGLAYAATSTKLVPNAPDPEVASARASRGAMRVHVVPLLSPTIAGVALTGAM
jgi:hypothetical protein